MNKTNYISASSSSNCTIKNYTFLKFQCFEIYKCLSGFVLKSLLDKMCRDVPF